MNPIDINYLDWHSIDAKCRLGQFVDYKDYKNWFSECREFLSNNCDPQGNEAGGVWFYSGHCFYIRDPALALVFKLRFM